MREVLNVVGLGMRGVLNVGRALSAQAEVCEIEKGRR